MSDVLEIALKNLRGKAQVAKEKGDFHLARAEEYGRDYLKYTTALEALQEVMGEPNGRTDADLHVTEEEAPAEPAQPFHNRSAFAQSLVIAKEPSGFRLALPVVQRELFQRHIYYPVARSHRQFSQFVRQSLIAAIQKHPGYRDYVANGGFDMGDNRGRSIAKIRHALSVLDVDVQTVEQQASELHDAIYMCGVEGTDYR